MGRSFYHFLMTYRDPRKHDPMTNFANAAYKDHGFPKQAKDYHTLSEYLELNATYLSGMALFDELYEKYKEDQEKNRH
ncbi:YozE family protein [Listeria costaricensis]|uniref:YozE family protein n=1 Tax=Listeria costaricensis TaxID=2026604 RepID=UPI000C081A3F|nr:YozE family protein [Listeria costaricensis]